MRKNIASVLCFLCSVCASSSDGPEEQRAIEVVESFWVRGGDIVEKEAAQTAASLEIKDSAVGGISVHVSGWSKEFACELWQVQRGVKLSTRPASSTWWEEGARRGKEGLGVSNYDFRLVTVCFLPAVFRSSLLSGPSSMSMTVASRIDGRPFSGRGSVVRTLSKTCHTYCHPISHFWSLVCEYNCCSINTTSSTYKPASKKRLFGVSLRFLFVGTTPGQLPISGFLSTEGFEKSPSFCTYIRVYIPGIQ